MIPDTDNTFFRALLAEPRLKAIDRHVSDLVAQADTTESNADHHTCGFTKWELVVIAMLPLVGPGRTYAMSPQGPIPFRVLRGHMWIRISPPPRDPNLPTLDRETERWLCEPKTAHALEDVWLTQPILAYPCPDIDQCPVQPSDHVCPECASW